MTTTDARKRQRENAEAAVLAEAENAITPRIEGTLHLPGGHSVAFTLLPDGTLHRYHATSTSAAALSVDVTEAIRDAAVDYFDDFACEGHESTDGPIGSVEFCDGTCKTGAAR